MPILIIGQCVSIFTEIRSKKKAHTEKSKKMSHTTSTVLSFLRTHTYHRQSIKLNKFVVGLFFSVLFSYSLFIFIIVSNVWLHCLNEHQNAVLYIPCMDFGNAIKANTSITMLMVIDHRKKGKIKAKKKQSTTTVLRNMRNLLTLSHERVKDKLVY